MHPEQRRDFQLRRRALREGHIPHPHRLRQLHGLNLGDLFVESPQPVPKIRVRTRTAPPQESWVQKRVEVAKRMQAERYLELLISGQPIPPAWRRFADRNSNLIAEVIREKHGKS